MRGDFEHYGGSHANGCKCVECIPKLRAPKKKPAGKLVLPPVPVGHLKLSQYRNLQKAIKKLTGYTITLSVVTRKKGKKK